MTAVRRLLIVGASARAAAASARRAGLIPVTIDYFADDDLRAMAEAHAVQGDSLEFAAVARTLKADAWMYVGAWENYPAAIEAISAVHPLAGNRPETLRGVRNPQRWSEVLLTAGVPVLEIRDHRDPPPADGTWLLKPVASGAGRKIRRWIPKVAEGKPLSEGFFFQRYRDAPVWSAAFLAGVDRMELVGCCSQASGAPGALDEFAYAGSCGPLVVSNVVRRRLQTIAETAGAAFGLRGLLGIDFLLEGDQPWVLEFNPRYTASMELFELASGRSLLADHLLACGFFPQPAASDLLQPGKKSAESGGPFPVVGKAIVYAPEPLRLVPTAHQEINDISHSLIGDLGTSVLYAGNSFPRPQTLRTSDAGGRPSQGTDAVGTEWRVPWIADIPMQGKTFQIGDPICTVMAAGSEPATLRAELDRLRQLVLTRLVCPTKQSG